MKHRHGSAEVGALLALALAAVACGSAPRTNYYTVDYALVPQASPNPARSRVGVAVPQAAHLLRQDRIVYFTNQNELNFYHYHRWAEPPTTMVHSLLLRQLRSAGLFGDVLPYRAQKGLEYILRGRLLAMEEVDTPTEVSARFGLELELVQQEGARVAWADRRTCTRLVGVDTVEAVVEAMSQCVEETLSQLTRSLGEAVSQLEGSPTAETEKRL